MAWTDVRIAIESRFATSFTTLDIAWKKDDFTPDADEAWVRFNVRKQIQTQESMGATSNIFREQGMIVIQLFTTMDSDNATDDGYLQDIIDVFQGKSFAAGTTEVIILDVKTQEIGRSGSWFQTNILIDFQYDDLVSMV